MMEALVVGTDSVGFAMARELRRHGVRCRAIDKADAPSRTSKALGAQARALEVFEKRH